MVCVEEDAASRHAAFDRLVTPEIGRLHGAARVLTRNGDTAEDLVQDTLVARIPRVVPIRRAPSAGVVADDPAQRLLQGRGPPARDSRYADVPVADLDDKTDAIAFDDALRRALATLPEAQRTIVQLVDIEGLTYAEAAAATGVPEGTVMSRLHRARTKLREQLLP